MKYNGESVTLTEKDVSYLTCLSKSDLELIESIGLVVAQEFLGLGIIPEISVSPRILNFQNESNCLPLKIDLSQNIKVQNTTATKYAVKTVLYGTKLHYSISCKSDPIPLPSVNTVISCDLLLF